MQNITTEKKAMLDTLMSALRDSVRQTFETMVFVPVECDAMQENPEGKPTGAISGSIGLTGEKICGSLSLVFGRETGEAMYRSMMMMDANAAVAETELRDAIAELANMVAGGAKSKAQELGLSFVISLPTVIVGDNHHLEAQRDATSYVVPVKSGKGVFHMQVSLSI
jgi:chemotaxis protein CheX